MNQMGTTCCLLALGLVTFNSRAFEAKQTPYDRIAERNLFKLRPASITQKPVPEPKPHPKVRLTGITMILKKPVAFITIEGGKPELSVTLGQGEAVKGIEVKSIDEKTGTVGILNEGELQILNFEPVKPTGQQFIGVETINVTLSPAPSPLSPVSLQKTEPSLSPEEQAALTELQRIKFQQEGNPVHSLLPPTELTRP